MTIRADQYPRGITTRQAVERCGGLTVLGRVINRKPQTIIKWKIIPTKHARIVCRLSGCPMEMIRPDLAIPILEQVA